MHNFSEAQIESCIQNSIDAVTLLLNEKSLIKNAGEMISHALKSGNKILTAGNGGSAAEALHLSEELIGRYKYDRKSLASLSLSADCTALTCIANDYGFESIYSRQIEGLGQEGDVFIAFSTSGNSKNIIKAVKAAKDAKMKVISLLGKDGGQLKGMGDYDIVVPAKNTENVQEAHQVILHILIEIVEAGL
jgi:D-sedoheptulose 7-phosphate isomerase